MKESINFSEEEKEKTSLNFSELRQKGMDYIQEFSGENWTDFNSHDPGVTILEQLCYALTDVSLRTSHNMNDLLTPKTNGESKVVEAKKNAFYSPSEIYKTHPVTVLDTRKVLIDNFSDIQNVWIRTTDNSGLEEKLVLTERIDILSKSILSSGHISKIEEEEKNIKKFISEQRNLGDDVETICFLKPKYISIEMEVHLVPKKNIDEIIAHFFIAIFEYVYTPVSQYTMEEMLDDGYIESEILSGPKLKNGFIKDDSLGERRIKISTIEVENNLSLVENIYKCEVKFLGFQGGEKDKKELQVGEDEFFHLFKEDDLGVMTMEFLETLCDNIKFMVNHEKVNKNIKTIHHLFYELWTKKYGPYAIRNTQQYEFNESLKGTNNNLKDYYSIQNHFPLIYGIGKEGLTSNASPERRAKAKQLKGYLLFFEQYLANHLSQISRIDDFFNIKEVGKQTYFSQGLNDNNVPNIKQIHPKLPTNDTEVPEKDFFDRKDRIYSHLLARFGEELNPTPLNVSRQKDIIESDEKLRDLLLNQKSNYLKKIESLSAEQIKGETFLIEKVEGKNKRQLSGLENIILAKTGISPRLYRALDINKYTNEETFYIVDHILLRDFFNENEANIEVKYGFKIIDAKDKIICKTDGQSWGTKEDRINSLKELLILHKNGDFFIKEDIDARLKTNNFENLVSFTDTDNPKTNKRWSRGEIKELVNLFNLEEPTNASSRLKELEKIRAKGTHKVTRGEYGQRRLIFQRKLSNFPEIGENEIVDEDFFNLSISIILPNWSARFQNEQFKSYLADLIMERVPSHIRVNLCSVDKVEMKSFAMEYHNWETLKSKIESDNIKESRNKFRKASYKVYTKICDIHKMNKDQAKQDREEEPPKPRNRLNLINNIVI